MRDAASAGGIAVSVLQGQGRPSLRIRFAIGDFRRPAQGPDPLSEVPAAVGGGGFSGGASLGQAGGSGADSLGGRARAGAASPVSALHPGIQPGGGGREVSVKKTRQT